MTQASRVPPGVDTSVPTPARIHDYMLLVGLRRER
jgi:hypothetical protein